MQLFKKSPGKLTASSQPLPNGATVRRAALTPLSQKNSGTHPILFIFLLLLVALLAAVATYTVIKLANSSTKQTSELAQQTQPVVKTTAEQAIAAVKARFTTTTTTTDVEPAWYSFQVPGYDFYTVIRDKQDIVGLKTTVTATDNASKVAEIGTELKAKGFTEQVEQGGTTVSYTANYTGSEAICTVDSLGSPGNEQADHAIQVICTDMSTYRAVAESQKPFVTAALATIETPAEVAMLGRAAIVTSKTADYSTATIGMGAVTGHAGASTLYFYQTPDKTWHYATRIGDTGPGVPCSDFAEENAKKAFLGEPCYILDAKDRAIQSTVK